jgi:hypothetical protein
LKIGRWKDAINRLAFPKPAKKISLKLNIAKIDFEA